MPINAHPEYIAAEKEYLNAKNLEEQIEKLKKMISLAPSHKGAENLRAGLKTRLKKLIEKTEKTKKSGRTSGIKKYEMQAVLVGKTNSGKSSVLNLLTNASPKISSYYFSTTKPQIGMMNYEDSQVQIIENPAINSEFYNKGLTNSADTLIFIVTNLDDIKEIKKQLTNNSAKQIIAFNKIDLLDFEQIRKIEATLKSKKYNFVLISAKASEGIENLKEKIFQSFNKIRIYTKEPGKEKSSKPIILNPGASVKDIAEKILHGFSNLVKETKIWGPSSKFSGQKVGLNHILKDKDVVEFRTR